MQNAYLNTRLNTLKLKKTPEWSHQEAGWNVSMFGPVLMIVEAEA
jgi:hypothetical protein